MKDEISFRQLVRILWKRKWLIGGITLAGGVLAVVFSLLLPNIYRADALLVPNYRDGAEEMSALASRYSGLAGLAGADLPSNVADKTTLGLEILKSRKFIADFVEKHDVLVPLMAATGWDRANDELEIDADIYDVETNTWVREVRAPRTKKPSAQEAYRKFVQDALRVTYDKEAGLVTVGIEHYSPVVARQWVDWLVQDLNETVMRADVAEAEQAIQYLEEQVASTSITELQVVFFRLIEEQTKTVMLARVSPEYLFKTIDPAVVPERKARPQRRLIVLLGLIGAGLLALGIVFVRDLDLA